MRTLGCLVGLAASLALGCSGSEPPAIEGRYALESFVQGCDNSYETPYTATREVIVTHTAVDGVDAYAAGFCSPVAPELCGEGNYIPRLSQSDDDGWFEDGEVSVLAQGERCYVQLERNMALPRGGDFLVLAHERRAGYLTGVTCTNEAAPAYWSDLGCGVRSGYLARRVVR